VSWILARLLVPEDFGLYAIALTATQFVIHVNDVGIIAATVQWRGRIEDMAATATTLAIAFSAAWYVLFWLVAPAFAELAGSPAATTVVRLLTATILVDGITAVRVAALQRGCRQDRLTKAIMAGFVANMTLAITLAANGSGPYSFVFGQLAASVVTGVLVMLFAGLPLRFGLDRAVTARLVRFGVPLAIGLGVESVLLNADYVIVGHVLGPAAIGLYLLSFDILTSLGATRSTVWLNLGWAVTLVPALMIGTHLNGIRGAAIAHAIIAVLVAVPLAVLVLHRGGVHLRPVAPALIRPLIGGARSGG